MRRCWSAWSAASPWPWSSSPGGPLGGEAAANDETFRRLRGAVAQLHASGITHNDLHPANVIVDGERVVLIDFASALRTPRWLRNLPVLRELRRSDLANTYRIERRVTGRAGRDRVGPGETRTFSRPRENVGAEDGPEAELAAESPPKGV